MAAITFEGYMGAGPAWADLGANTLVFSGGSDLTTPVTVGAYQDGTHAGNGTPGIDQCGANHINNVKWLTSSTMSVNGGGSESINDTNLADNECTLRLHFNHGSNVTVSGARLFCYDGTTEANEAVELHLQAFERGRTATAWTVINDDSGNIGGDNSGERLDLADKGTPAQDFYWYIALSFSPETVGAKSNFSLKMYLTYS